MTEIENRGLQNVGIEEDVEMDTDQGGNERVEDNESVASELSQESLVGSLVEDMREALDEVKCLGTFAKHSYVDREVAGVHIDGVGRIKLPLQEGQARQIIGQARKAPVDGTGVVDLAVRDTWELLPGQFKLLDPEWSNVVKRLCEEIAVDMGLPMARIYASLDRMLLYEKGSMYKSHTDSVRQHRMIGTLVIRLPANHYGGAVVAEHCGVKRFLTTHSTGEDPRAAIWWFRNIAHEVRPVEHGWRWVLRYNLIADPCLRPSIPSNHFTAILARNDLLPEPRYLRHTLRRWLSQCPAGREVDCLYLGLEHDYPEKRLISRELKTRDLKLYDTLDALAQKLPIEIFLAIVQKSEEGECYPIYDAHTFIGRGPYDPEKRRGKGPHFISVPHGEAKYAVTKVADAYDGKQLCSNISVLLDEIIQSEEEFFERSRIAEDYNFDERYLKQWTKRTAIVIVPRDTVVDYLKPHGRLKQHDYNAAAYYLDGLCSVWRPFSNRAKDIAATLWHQFYYDFLKPYNGLAEVSHDVRGRVLSTAIQHKDWSIWEELIESLKTLPRHPFPPWPFLCALREVFESDEVLDHIKDGLFVMLDKIDTLAKQCEAIEEFTNYYVDGDVLNREQDEAFEKKVEQVSAWARRAFAHVLNSRRHYDLTLEDGYELAHVAFGRFDPTFVETTVGPFFMRHHTNFSFSLAFITKLNFHQDNVEFGLSEVQNFLVRLATVVLEQFRAPALHTTDTRGNEEFLNRAADAEHLIEFLRVLNTASFPEGTILTLLSTVTKQADQIEGKELGPLWLPFLRMLITFLDEEFTKLPLPSYRDLYVAILEAYLKRYVGQEPSKKYVTEGPQPPVPCSCHICRRLNRFLTSDIADKAFTVRDEDHRIHLRRMLKEANIACKVLDYYDEVIIKKPPQISRWWSTWQGKVVEANKELRQFDQAKLRMILGDKYSDIMELKATRAQPATA